MFPGTGGMPFRGINKHSYEARIISQIEATDIQTRLSIEASSLYYKALLSYMECIPAIKHNNYSWSTVRLYYSIYYAIRAYLACNGIAFMRAERRLFYIRARANERFIRCEDTTDHKAVMRTLYNLYKNTDKLLSNNINGINVNEWMMDRREEVNYRDMDFHDPSAPEFWNNIDAILETTTLESLIDDLVKDNWLYCFQDDYGILGIPTKRLMITTNAIKSSGLISTVSDDKKQFIERYADALESSSKSKLIAWK